MRQSIIMTTILISIQLIVIQLPSHCDVILLFLIDRLRHYWMSNITTTIRLETFHRCVVFSFNVQPTNFTDLVFNQNHPNHFNYLDYEKLLKIRLFGIKLKYITFLYFRPRSRIEC